MTHLLTYIIENLERLSLRYEIHQFDSGSVMIDLWINDNFHVIQIDENSIGLSLVTEATMPFDIIPDISFSNEAEFKKEFKKILPLKQSTEKKTLIIDGKDFETLEQFYSEVDEILTKGLTWETGHNLDAFSDLLRGGFGVHDYEEPIKLIWRNSNKSKLDLTEYRNNETLYVILVTIIREHKHIEFIEQ